MAPTNGGTIVEASIAGLENMLTLPTGAIRCKIGQDEVAGIYESVTAKVRCNAIPSNPLRSPGRVPFSVAFDGESFSNEVDFEFLSENTALDTTSPQSVANALGGTDVTVNGKVFVAGADLTCKVVVGSNDRPRGEVRWVSSTQVICRTPPLPQVSGSYTYEAAVSISNNDQQYSAPITLQMHAAPTVTLVTPAVKLNTVDAAVTLTATEFQDVTGLLKCKFGCVQGDYCLLEEQIVDATFVSSTEVSCIAPAIADYTGRVQVGVSHDGQTYSSDVVTIEYYSVPQIRGTSPTASFVAGGTTVTIIGSGFPSTAPAADILCKFGDQTSVATITSGQGLYPTEMTCMIPASSSIVDTAVDVTVSFDGGASFAKSSTQLMYYMPSSTSCPSPPGGSVCSGINGNCNTNACNCVAGFASIDCSESVMIKTVTPSVVFGSNDIPLEIELFFAKDLALAVPVKAYTCKVGGAAVKATYADKKLKCKVPAPTESTSVSVEMDGVTVASTYPLNVTAAPTVAAFEGLDNLGAYTPDAAMASSVNPIVVKGDGFGVVGSSSGLGGSVGGATVQLGDVGVPGWRLVDASTLQVWMPSAADFNDLPSSKALTINFPSGTKSAAGSLVVYETLIVDTITPSSGSSAGGTVVTFSLSKAQQAKALTGKNPRCRFGAPLASPVVVRGELTFSLGLVNGIRCTAPTLPVGRHRASASLDSADYFDAPQMFHAYAEIESLSGTKQFGPLSGGELVTVSGKNFIKSESLNCKFGQNESQACTAAFISTEMVLCQAPSSTVPGDVTVVVSNNGQVFTASGPQFGYYADIKVGKIQPSMGPTEGGTKITLSGANFRNSTRLTVRLGAVDASNVKYISSSVITCEVPAVAGYSAEFVTVSNEGRSFTAPSEASTFRYYEDLGLKLQIIGTAASPTSGLTRVTIEYDVSGEKPGFVMNPNYDPRNLRVQFLIGTGGTVVDKVLMTGTELTVVAPTSSTSGIAGVRISFDGGQHYSSSTAEFIYYIPASVTLSPALGPISGSTNISVVANSNLLPTLKSTPDNFGKLTSAATCRFEVNPVVFVSAKYDASTGSYLCVSPAAAIGAYSVSFALDGQQYSSGVLFEYYTEPLQVSIYPRVGIQEGGTEITLKVESTSATFASYYKTMTCGFDVSLPYPIRESVRPTSPPKIVGSYYEVKCVTPSVQKLSFPVNATVKLSLNGQQYVERGNDYFFHPRPDLTRINPAAGTISGGSVITLAGTGFFDAASLGVFPSAVCMFKSATQKFNSTAQLNSPFRTVCNTPPVSEPSAVQISVSVNGLSTEQSNFLLFQYVSSTITAIIPPEGPLSGDTSVLVVGSGFIETDELSCYFGGESSKYNANNKRVEFINSTHLRCISPAFTQMGSYEFSISIDGQNFNLNPGVRFAYYSRPAVTGLKPMSGPLRGGTNIEVTGYNLRATLGMQCIFGGNATPAYQVNSTLVRCNSPYKLDSKVGAVSFEFSQNGQQATESQLQFSYYEDSVVTFATPLIGPDRASGERQYGTKVAVTGVNFINSTDLQCKFGDTVSTFRVDFVNSTLVNCFTTVSGQVTTGVVQNISVSNNGQQFSLIQNSSSGAILPYQQFTFYKSPEVSGISTTDGRLGGGEIVTMTGRFFSSTGALSTLTKLSCTFGNLTASATLVSSTSVLCETPASSVGRTVSVGISLNGMDYSYASQQFNFNSSAPILLLEVTPSAAAIYARFVESNTANGRRVGARDVATDTGGMKINTPVSCNALFDESTVQLFGSNPKCMWKDSATFEVVTGLNPSYTLTSGMKLNPSIVIRKANEPSFAVDILKTYNVKPPAERPNPTAVLEAAGQIGQCEEALVLDGTLSYGSGARAFSKLEWSVESIFIDGMNPASLKILLAQLQTQFTTYTNVATQMSLEIKQFNISGGMNPLPSGTYIFGLKLTNWLGGENKALRQISKQGEAIPLLYVKGGNSVETNPFAELTFEAVGAPATCGALTTPILAYEWTMVPETAAFKKLNRFSSSMSIPAFTLKAGLTYTLLCKLDQGSASNNVTTKIYVASNNPVVQIAGGAAFEWGIHAPLTLDASGSFDLDVSPTLRSYKDLVWHWKCTNSFGCPEIVEPSARIIVLPAYSMNVGVEYTFEVLVSKALDQDKFSLMTTVVTGIIEPVPLVELLINIPSFSTKVDARYPVNFGGKGITATSSSYLRSFSFSINPPLDETLSQYSMAPMTGDLAGELSTVQDINWGLKAGALTPGKTYTVSLSVTDSAGYGGSASVMFTVNTGATSGNFTISPMSGTALTTEFEFNAADWTDVPAQTPLMYQFSYMGQIFNLDGTAETRKVPLGAPSYSSRKSNVLLPAGSLVNDGLEVVLDIFNKDMSVSTVTKVITVTGLGTDESSVAQIEALVRSQATKLTAARRSEEVKVLLDTAAELLNAVARAKNAPETPAATAAAAATPAATSAAARRLLQAITPMTMRTSWIEQLNTLSKSGPQSLSGLGSAASALEALVSVPKEISAGSAKIALELVDYISEGDGDNQLETATITALASSINSLLSAISEFSSSVPSPPYADDLVLYETINLASNAINKLSARDSNNMFPNQFPVYRSYAMYKMATYRIPWTPTSPPTTAPVFVSPCKDCTDISSLPRTMLEKCENAD